MELPDSSSAVAQAHSHTLHPENNSRQENIPNPNTSFCDHTVTRPIPWTQLFTQVGYRHTETLLVGTSLPTSRVPSHGNLSAGTDPIKVITHLS
jgi:hypothetical protein